MKIHQKISHRGLLEKRLQYVRKKIAVKRCSYTSTKRYTQVFAQVLDLRFAKNAKEGISVDAIDA